MPAKWQRFSVEIPKGYTPAEREVIAEEIIDFIRKRTQKGEDWKHDKFPDYSEEYEKSLNFKIAGKKRGQTPDLTLSGDMLGALTVLSHANGKLLIGYENGTEENAIADGNIRGTYGKSKPNKNKARDFLEIDPTDLRKILAQHPLEDEGDTADAQVSGSKRAKRVADDISAGVEEGATDGE